MTNRKIFDFGRAFANTDAHIKVDSGLAGAQRAAPLNISEHEILRLGTRNRDTEHPDKSGEMWRCIIAAEWHRADVERLTYLGLIEVAAHADGSKVGRSTGPLDEYLIRTTPAGRMVLELLRVTP